MARPVNAAALAIADAAEGCVLHAYRDSSGVLTAGWGHTGADVRAGMAVSQAQADAWRAADLRHAAAFVEAHVSVPLTDNQFSALAEFTYNVGVGAFAGSSLRRRLNAGDYLAVPGELMRWTRAGGRVLPGLVSRRAAEAALFARPDAGLPSPPGAGLLRASPPSPRERLGRWLHDRARR